jgi:hypothetical protein
MIGIVLMLLAGATGCGLFQLDDHPVLFVSNRTDLTLDVVLSFDNGGENVVASDLAPGGGMTYDFMGDCEEADLVARDPAGVEVARKEGPICRPSEWVIRAP